MLVELDFEIGERAGGEEVVGVVWTSGISWKDILCVVLLMVLSAFSSMRRPLLGRAHSPNYPAEPHSGLNSSTRNPASLLLLPVQSPKTSNPKSQCHQSLPSETQKPKEHPQAPRGPANIARAARQPTRSLPVHSSSSSSSIHHGADNTLARQNFLAVPACCMGAIHLVLVELGSAVVLPTSTF
jgi:hypothetical protein